MEKETDKGLKRFGFYFAIGMLILLFISFYRNFNIYLKITISILFLYHILFAFIKPSFLKPTFFLTSKIGFFIGEFITKAVLTIFFYLIFTPISLILRLSGRDEIKKNSIKSCWQDIKDEENNPERVKKMY